MRTTLEIEDDVLLAAKELARREHTTAGKVISDLARRSLTQANAMTADQAKEAAAAHGFRPFPPRGGVITNELVDRLRDENGI
jgi:hypothetical protein